jgi:hypothetical protein
MKRSSIEGAGYVLDDLESSSSSTNKLNSIVIPSINNEIYYFNPKCYDKKLLEKYISKEEFDDIIFNASKIYGNSLYEKQNNDKFKINFTNKLSVLISLILILFYPFFFYLSHISKNGLVLFIFSIFFCFATLINSIILSFMNYCKANREFITLKKIIKTNLDNFLKITNKNLENRGKGNIEFSYNNLNRSIVCIIENNETINEIKEEENENSEDDNDKNEEEEKKEDEINESSNNLKLISKNSESELSDSKNDNNFIFNFSKSELSSNNEEDNKQISPKETNKNLVRQQSYKMNRNNILKSSAKNIKKIYKFTRK